VARERSDGEGDGRFWEKLCEHYTHVPAMNRRASQGIMCPVLPEERMVSLVVVSSDARGDNASEELPVEHRLCESTSLVSSYWTHQVLVGLGGSNRS